jgi:hypothetical protein
MWVAGVGVKVVRNLAHVGVERPVALPENLVCNTAKAREHQLELLRRGFDTMASPYDHRDPADLALGDPADLVLVVPGRKRCGLTQIAFGT